MMQARFSCWDPVNTPFRSSSLGPTGCISQNFASTFPDRRLFRCFVQVVEGVIAASVPIVCHMAAAVLQCRDPRSTHHVAKHCYRWWGNPRFRDRELLKLVYALTRARFREEKQSDSLVLLDFTNLEKPYGYRFEALCTLRASRLHYREGKVGLTCAQTISCRIMDFIRLSREVLRAIRFSRVLLRGHRARLVCDRGWEDERMFAEVNRLQAACVSRLCRPRRLLVQCGEH